MTAILTLINASVQLAAAAVFEIEASRSFSSVSIARRASGRWFGPR